VRVLCIYLCFFLATLPITSFSQEAGTPPECSEAIPLTSPCSGVLLPTTAAAEALRCLKIDTPKLKLELQFEKDLCESREKRFTALLSAEQERGDKLFALHKESIIATRLSWYEHPVFWFAVGFVVATTTTVGITYAVNNPDN